LGGVVSDATGRYLSEIFVVKDKLTLRERQMDQLRDRFFASEETLKKLESRISSQFVSEMDILQSLTKSKQYKTVGQLEQDLLLVIQKYLHAGRCRLFRVSGDRLVEKQFDGSDQSGVELTRPDQDLLLFECLRTKRIAYVEHVMGEGDFDRYRKQSILAGPILDLKGDVRLVVGVFELPFIDYNPSAFKLFETILGWWGTEMGEKKRVEELASRGVLNEQLGVYNYDYFLRRFREEFNRARQFSIPLSFGLVRINQFEQVAEEKKGDVLAILSKIMTQNVTELEMVANYHKQGVFACVFPVVGENAAEKRLANVVSEINDYAFTPYKSSEDQLSIAFGVKDFQIGMESADSLIAAVEKEVLN